MGKRVTTVDAGARDLLSALRKYRRQAHTRRNKQVGATVNTFGVSANADSAAFAFCHFLRGEAARLLTGVPTAVTEQEARDALGSLRAQPSGRRSRLGRGVILPTEVLPPPPTVQDLADQPDLLTKYYKRVVDQSVDLPRREKDRMREAARKAVRSRVTGVALLEVANAEPDVASACRIAGRVGLDRKLP